MLTEEVISVTIQIKICSTKLIGKLIVPAPQNPHCGYDIPKAHQYFPLPPPDAPIFMPDIETL